MLRKIFENFRISIDLTMSKVVAVMILWLAWDLDRHFSTQGTIFQFSLPFVSGLIFGKQGLKAMQEKFNNKKPS